MVASQPGEVFRNDGLDGSVLDALHHFHEAGAVEVRAAPSVIDKEAVIHHAVFPRVVFKDMLLVADGIALALQLVVAAQAAVKSGNRGFKGLLSQHFIPPVRRRPRYSNDYYNGVRAVCKAVSDFCVMSKRRFLYRGIIAYDKSAISRLTLMASIANCD